MTAVVGTLPSKRGTGGDVEATAGGRALGRSLGKEGREVAGGARAHHVKTQREGGGRPRPAKPADLPPAKIAARVSKFQVGSAACRLFGKEFQLTSCGDIASGISSPLTPRIISKIMI